MKANCLNFVPSSHLLVLNIPKKQQEDIMYYRNAKNLSREGREAWVVVVDPVPPVATR